MSAWDIAERTKKTMSDAWQDWCLECVEEARGYATQNGTTIETAMLRILPVLMDETMARFPDVELNVALHELAWWAGKADHDAAAEKSRQD